MTQQYTPNQIAAMLANPQYRGQAEQYLSSTFGRIAPQASERTYTLRGMTSSDDNGALINQTPYYTDQSISSWYGAGDWTAGREGRFAGTQAPTGDFMAIMSGQGDEFSPGFQTTGYTVDLTPDFRDERGYGRYVGTYDAQGNLTGTTFQRRNLSQGWLGDNMGTWGPLLVGGLAALGAGGFLPGMTGGEAAAAGSGSTAAGAAGGAGGSLPSLGGIDLASAGAVNLPGGTTAMMAGAKPAAFMGAGGFLGGLTPAAGSAAGGWLSNLLPGGVKATDVAKLTPLLGGVGGAPSAPNVPVQDTGEAALQDSIGKINSLFGDRSGLYDQVRKDVYDLQASRLGERREDTLRKLRFGAARTGLTGGSVDVSNKGLEQREFGRALMDASNTAQGRADEMRANDEKTRLNLIAQMRSGLGSADATQSALATMQDNLTAARNDQRFDAIDAYSGAVAPAIERFGVQQGRARANEDYGRIYRSPSSYTGTLTR